MIQPNFLSMLHEVVKALILKHNKFVRLELKNIK